jgi:hypothetical protein
MGSINSRSEIKTRLGIKTRLYLKNSQSKKGFRNGSNDKNIYLASVRP